MEGGKLMLPQDYRPSLDVRQTQRAIKELREVFQNNLAAALNLQRISAPLFVAAASGLNDNLSGVERPVGFDIPDTGDEVQIVQSLAKWKRQALGEYGFPQGEGMFTDMNAIRRDEKLDNLHSVYVDQWDWEAVIGEDERTEAQLHTTVRRIYGALKAAAAWVAVYWPPIRHDLPHEITVVTAQQLEDCWPGLTPKARENAICREAGAVFIQGIGAPLKSGQPHDGRAPDYDDWALNGDILVWHEPLQCAMELSSMGIRVDAPTLQAQLEAAGSTDRAGLPFHRALLEGRLPQTMGGGIGQSRLCMFLLKKAHIGEVQASVWPREMMRDCREQGIALL